MYIFLIILRPQILRIIIKILLKLSKVFLKRTFYKVFKKLILMFILFGTLIVEHKTRRSEKFCNKIIVVRFKNKKVKLQSFQNTTSNERLIEF